MESVPPTKTPSEPPAGLPSVVLEFYKAWAASLIKTGKEKGLKVIIGFDVKLSSAYFDSKYRDYLLKYVEEGREMPLYESFGASLDCRDSFTPNMMNLKYWQLFVDEINDIVKETGCHGIYLSSGGMHPLVYRRDFAELTKTNSKLDHLHSEEQRYLGGVVKQNAFVAVGGAVHYQKNCFLNFIANRICADSTLMVAEACTLSGKRGEFLKDNIQSVAAAGMIAKVAVGSVLPGKSVPWFPGTVFTSLNQLNLEYPRSLMMASSGLHLRSLLSSTRENFTSVSMVLDLLPIHLLSFDFEFIRGSRRLVSYEYFAVSSGQSSSDCTARKEQFSPKFNSTQLSDLPGYMHDFHCLSRLFKTNKRLGLRSYLASAMLVSLLNASSQSLCLSSSERIFVFCPSSEAQLITPFFIEQAEFRDFLTITDLDDDSLPVTRKTKEIIANGLYWPKTVASGLINRTEDIASWNYVQSIPLKKMKTKPTSIP